MNQDAVDLYKSKKKITLKPTDRKTIIFDLDETLIHCQVDNLKASDIVLHVNFPNGEDMEVVTQFHSRQR